MRHTRWWWVAIAGLLAYVAAFKLTTAGMLDRITPPAGSPLYFIAAPIIFWLLIFSFVGLLVVLPLFGGALWADIMTWREARREPDPRDGGAGASDTP
jgi:hypothetical protein